MVCRVPVDTVEKQKVYFIDYSLDSSDNLKSSDHSLV